MQRPAGLRLRVEVEDEGSRVVVAVDGRGEIVGLAAAGTARDPDAPTGWELYSIQTVTWLRGSGVADELLHSALGDGAASVWVLRANARARSFYRRHGFSPDGMSRPYDGDGAPEVRMVRGADPGGPASR